MRMKNREKLSFLPQNLKEIFKQMTTTVQQNIRRQVVKFYSVVNSYLEVWVKCLDGTGCFNWMHLFAVPEWSKVVKTIAYAASKCGDSFQSHVNADEVFDEITLVSPYITASTASWNQKSSSPEDRWKDVFEHFLKLDRSVKNLEKLVEFYFSIPGSACEVERLFSIIGRV
jgi:hypothetical protein